MHKSVPASPSEVVILSIEEESHHKLHIQKRNWEFFTCLFPVKDWLLLFPILNKTMFLVILGTLFANI